MYRRALDEGLFPSNRKLAEAVGVDLSALGKALALAALPGAVVAAFPSPLEIQFRWAKPLADRIAADPEGVASLAGELSRRTPRPAAKDVFHALVGLPGQGGGTVPPPPVIDIEVGGKLLASVSATSKGGMAVSIQAGALAVGQMPALAKLVEEFLVSRNKR